jgi:cobalt-zinc-cadmium efflux system protein
MGSTMVDPRSSPPQAVPASDADQYSLLHIHKRGDAAHSHRRETSNASLLGIALAITFSFAIVEAIAGYLAGSLALLSDAAHMVTDAAALGLALFAQIISRRPPSARHSFGFGRAEALAAFVNAIAMLILVAWIVGEAITRFYTPHVVDGLMVAIVAAIGLVMNVIVATILSRDKKSVNTRAALVHVMGDLLGSIAALVSGVVIYFSGWMEIDAWLSILVALLILKSTFAILKESYHFLMEGVPLSIDYIAVGKDLHAVKGVRAVHDLHVWEMSPNQPALIGHIEVDSLRQWPALMRRINAMLLERHGIDHVTLQPELVSDLQEDGEQKQVHSPDTSATPKQIHRGERFYVECASSNASGLHRMAYHTWGDPSNPRVLICVHGLTRRGSDFRTLAEALCKDYYVVCPDVVGRGDSDFLENPMLYGIPQYVADMTTLVARLNVTSVDWFGTSMGGLIGMVYAGMPDSPIRRILINDVGPRIEPESLKRLSSYVGQPFSYSDRAEALTVLNRICASFGSHTPEEWERLNGPLLQEVNDVWSLHYDPKIVIPFAAVNPVLAKAGEMALWNHFDAITVPILIVRGGDSDLLSSATVDEMLKRNPHARSITIPGVGHAPAFLKSEQIALAAEFFS